MTREIPISKGYVALVDDEDYGVLAGFKWCRGKGGYAVRYLKLNGRATCSRMHREILDVPSHLVVDHINGDPLDNRRANLRACSTRENSRNRRRHTPGYKGVKASGKKFAAAIFTNGEGRHLGSFASPIAAARAYDRAATRDHGGFASLNFDASRDWIFPHEAVGVWPPAEPPRRRRAADAGLG